uniref:Uncharacterized protein n=1 Tax=Ananas comosus var. bracteatus TaxID=296719 RepID=A0A6V7P104_ANACO|nr:unnamed protein product [Ananas comosus var. bracteatus]
MPWIQEFEKYNITKDKTYITKLEGFPSGTARGKKKDSFYTDSLFQGIVAVGNIYKKGRKRKAIKRIFVERSGKEWPNVGGGRILQDVKLAGSAISSFLRRKQRGSFDFAAGPTVLPIVLVHGRLR